MRDDEDDDEEEGEDGGNKRWRVVGNWKELQDVIGRVGSVVEVRSRNESFEVGYSLFLLLLLCTTPYKRKEKKN